MGGRRHRIERRRSTLILALTSAFVLSGAGCGKWRGKRLYDSHRGAVGAKREAVVAALGASGPASQPAPATIQPTQPPPVFGPSDDPRTNAMVLGPGDETVTDPHENSGFDL